MSNTSPRRTPTDPNYARVKALFEAVCELPVEAQQDALRAAGASDETIASVLQLLERDREAAALVAARDTTTGGSRIGLGRPVAAMLGSLAANDIAVGDQLGPWQISSVLGTGGMGTVYKAERVDGKFSQTAAIKVLAGLPTSEMLAYLTRERQILASLSHPNIARLIDGGTTPHGNPYLAMDYVDGTDIDTYCATNKLAVRDVVQLFQLVCRAVAYAHQRLTLHCDLKPSNVMIDRLGRPILLDFGISQLFDPSHDESSGERLSVFTPKFASPEQQSGQPMTTASDVYSLGRMLEVLTPASRPRELAAIIARASHADAASRYPTAAALDVDLERWLRGRPVEALPRSWWYATQKFLQRRWGLVAASLAFVVMGAGLTINATIQRDRAELAELQARQELARAVAAEDRASAERDRAQVAESRAREGADAARSASALALRERDRAVKAEQDAKREAERAVRAEVSAVLEGKTSKEVRDFMVGIFDSMASSNVGARRLTAYELLEQGRNDINTKLAAQPLIRSELLQTLARIYDNIGETDVAKRLYRQMAEIERDPKTGRPALLAYALSRAALAESNSANSAAGEAEARESLELRRKLFGEIALETADSHGTLGLILSGMRRHAEAREHLEKCLAIRQQLLPATDASIASAWHNLGQAGAQAGEHERGIAAYRRAVELKAKLLGDGNQSTLNSVQGLAQTLWRAGKLTEAEPEMVRVYRGMAEIHGRDSERFAYAADALSGVLQDMGRYADARVKMEEAVAVLAKPAPAQRTLRFATFSANFALLLNEMGDAPAAERAFKDAIAVRERISPPDDLLLARNRAGLGSLLTRLNRFDEAGVLLGKAAAVREKRLSAGDGELIEMQIMQVDWLLDSGNVAEAANRFAAIKLPANISGGRRIGYTRIAKKIKLAQGDYTAALKLADEQLNLSLKLNGTSHPRANVARLDYAAALAAAGDKAAAKAFAESLRTAFAGVFDEKSSYHQQLAKLLAL